MNEKIIRPGLIKRVVDLLKCRNKKYTQEDVENIVSAFWNVIYESIENGDSIKINNYVKMEPKYYKAVKLNANGFNNITENIVPARYRIRFTMGERLKEACRRCRFMEETDLYERYQKFTGKETDYSKTYYAGSD